MPPFYEVLISRLPHFYASARDIADQPPYPDIERVAWLIGEARQARQAYPAGALIPLRPDPECLHDLRDAWDVVGRSAKALEQPDVDAYLLEEACKRLRLAGDCTELAPLQREAPLWGSRIQISPYAVRASLRRLSRGFGGWGPWVAPLRSIVPVGKESPFPLAGR